VGGGPSLPTHLPGDRKLKNHHIFVDVKYTYAKLVSTMQRSNAMRIHSKFWVFTSYTYSTAEEWKQLPSGVTCLAWQEERCPTTDRLHLQGYIELIRDREVSWLRKHISMTAYWRKKVTLSTRLQAFTYTQKDESRTQGPYCLGTPPTPSSTKGQRVDLEAFRDACFKGMSERKLWSEFTVQMAKYPRMYKSIAALARPKRSTDLEVVLIYGSTGVGKTRLVYEKWEDSDEFWRWAVPNTTCWFDGYDGHKLCLLDDFAGKASKMSLVMLLQVLDRYPVLLPVKGSHIWWMPDAITITTNIHPREWYDYTNRIGQYMAIKRRIHHVIDMGIIKDEGGDLEDAGSTFWYDPMLFPRPQEIDLTTEEVLIFEHGFDVL